MMQQHVVFLTPEQQVQLDLVKAIAKRTRTPIVVVLINGGAIDVEWMVKSDRVSAIVEAWYARRKSTVFHYRFIFDSNFRYPGQEGGTAIADVLLGKVNPSGRLPVTVYLDRYTSIQVQSILPPTTQPKP